MLEPTGRGFNCALMCRPKQPDGEPRLRSSIHPLHNLSHSQQRVGPCRRGAHPVRYEQRVGRKQRSSYSVVSSSHSVSAASPAQTGRTTRQPSQPELRPGRPCAARRLAAARSLSWLLLSLLTVCLRPRERVDGGCHSCRNRLHAVALYHGGRMPLRSKKQDWQEDDGPSRCLSRRHTALSDGTLCG